jgi:ribulose-phosphate 3-epimerase
MTTPLICPSILASDFAKLGEEVRAITEAGADWVHIDVMDGHFVPNITIGPDVVKALRPHSNLPFDCHLMSTPVYSYLEDFKNAGADYISQHPEAGPNLHRSLKYIRQLCAKAGVVLNPATPVEILDWIMDDIDLVLVMSVNPGFGGQSFIDSQLRKIEVIRKKLDAVGHPAILQVDGGVNAGNAHKCMEAGATAMVAGTAVFKGGPSAYAANIKQLKGL